MIKTKSQLRAEAVERLRTISPTQATSSAYINALIGPIELRPDLTAGQDIIDALIDLLTDEHDTSAERTCTVSIGEEVGSKNDLESESGITLRDILDFGKNARKQRDYLRAKIDALRCERNMFRDDALALKSEVDELEDELKKANDNFKKATSLKRMWTKRYNELQAKHKLPYGIEWPKFEDGVLVNIDDEILYGGCTKTVQGIRFYRNSVVFEFPGVDHCREPCGYYYGETVCRPRKDDSIDHVIADLRNNGIDSIADRIERLVKQRAESCPNCDVKVEK